MKLKSKDEEEDKNIYVLDIETTQKNIKKRETDECIVQFSVFSVNPTTHEIKEVETFYINPATFPGINEHYANSWIFGKGGMDLETVKREGLFPQKYISRIFTISSQQEFRTPLQFQKYKNCFKTKP